MSKKELIKENYTFEDLVAIVSALRAEDGCAWDRQQTHESLRKNLIEECYEAAEGIDRKDPKLLCEELGDILLQVVFHAQLSNEEGMFTVSDVVNGISKKMVYRHPHVFGDCTAEDPTEAYRNWEEMKLKEKATTTLYEDADRIARTLPSVMRSQKILKKMKKAGMALPDDQEDLTASYLALCERANEVGLDLEELGYKINEELIEAIKKEEDHEN